MNVMIGVDPHKASHTTVAIDDDEQVLDQIRVRATRSQATELAGWAGRFESRIWGSTRSSAVCGFGFCVLGR